MIRIRRLAEQATERAAQREYRCGYFDGVHNLNPPNPEALSTDYRRGYSRGQFDAGLSSTLANEPKA